MIEKKPINRKSWFGLVLLLVALVSLLLVGDVVDRLPQPTVMPDGPLLRGWRRRVAQSLPVLPSELGGPGQPGFYPPPGMYERSVRVELRPDNRRATVIFTTDGSLPTLEHGAVYRQPLHLDVQQSGVTVIRAIQVLNGTPGPDVTAVYVVGLNSQVPVLSLVADPDDLWGVEQGILVKPSFRGVEWERPVHVNFVDGHMGFDIPAGLRIHGSEPLLAEKQSLRLYFRGSYGATRLTYPLYPGHPEQWEDAQSYNRLLLQAGDRNGWWTLFRDELVVQTARSLNLATAQGRFVHLFINGRSWGLYRLSERVDRFFLNDNFGYRDVDVVREGSAQEGSDDDWDDLVDWAVAHDLADAEAYTYVKEQLDVANFTDFAVLQLYFGFCAEDLYAVRDRGGRWHFVYGGGAQAFAHRPKEPLAALGMEETDFALLLRALMDNADFRRGMQRRSVNLLNTVLSPQAMEERVWALTEQLSSDVRYEAARWPAPTEWADNVALLQSFVAARPAALRDALADVLQLGASVTVQIQADPPEAGRVFAGDLQLPGEGDFFAGTRVEFTAVPQSGFTFESWEGVIAPDASPVLAWTVEGPGEIIARFRAISRDDPGIYPNDVIINEVWIDDNGTRYRSLGNRPLTGDWIELLVMRPQVVDLRGWRLTDNDTKAGTDEGSIIFPNLDAFAAVPRGTVILIIASDNLENAAYFPTDDLDHSDGRMILYVGNGTLDIVTDPGFGLSTRNDNLVLLAPGLGGAAGHQREIGIDFVAEGTAVTPYSFGVLADGVVFENPFRRLGRDNGALFTGVGSNDNGADAWIVDPSPCESGDAFCLHEVNILTPGALNPGQRSALWWARLLGK